MGLDVTAYSKIAPIDCVYDADGEPIDPRTRKPLEGHFFTVFVNSDFPGRADDLKAGGVYTYDGALAVPCGAYSRYNRWRNDLAAMAGWPVGQYEQYGRMWDSNCVACWNGAQGPFSELINFSDCDGTIGTAVSKKLAADFAEFQTKADQYGDAAFLDQYALWRRAFELASDNGAVRFH